MIAGRQRRKEQQVRGRKGTETEKSRKRPQKPASQHNSDTALSSLPHNQPRQVKSKPTDRIGRQLQPTALTHPRSVFDPSSPTAPIHGERIPVQKLQRGDVSPPHGGHIRLSSHRPSTASDYHWRWRNQPASLFADFNSSQSLTLKSLSNPRLGYACQQINSLRYRHPKILRYGLHTFVSPSPPR